MSYDEQTVIEKFFRHLGAVRTDVALGIGDDAALLRAQPGCELVQTIDVLVEDVHFLADSAARSLGHRALAVNLSDLAAMGARPYWALLSLTLPRIDVDWLGEFAAGFGILARTHEVALVGGNLSRGPLTITVQLTGQVPVGTALRRGGARADDDLWVSGTLGDASVGRSLLAKPRGEAQADWLRARFEFPTPRVALGEALRGVASACIDLSDGMLADAPRLCVSNYYFGPKPASQETYLNVTTFAGRPEEFIKRPLLKLDATMLNAVGKTFPKLTKMTRHRLRAS